MQTISEDKDERDNDRETNPMNLVICTERVSRCVEGEYAGRFRGRENRI